MWAWNDRESYFLGCLCWDTDSNPLLSTKCRYVLFITLLSPTRSLILLACPLRMLHGGMPAWTPCPRTSLSNSKSSGPLWRWVLSGPVVIPLDELSCWVGLCVCVCVCVYLNVFAASGGKRWPSSGPGSRTKEPEPLLHHPGLRYVGKATFTQRLHVKLDIVMSAIKREL